MKRSKFKPSGGRSPGLHVGLGLAVAAMLGLAGCKKGSEAEGEGRSSSAAKASSAAEQDEQDGEPTKDLPEAEALLDKAVEAVGGRDKLDEVESFYYKGKISIAGQNIGGDIEIWWKNGDFYTTQEMAGIGQIQAGKQGDTIWSQDPINGLRELEGPEAEQHTWASSLMLAADWKQYFEKAETVAEREVDDKTVYDVKLTSPSGAQVRLTFDAETGLQVAQEFKQVTPMGQMPVKVVMEDYRDVDGIKIAFKQVTDASLAKATQEIVELKLNPEVDTSRFAMPTGDTEVVSGADKDPGPAMKDTPMPFDEDGKPGKPAPSQMNE